MTPRFACATYQRNVSFVDMELSLTRDSNGKCTTIVKYDNLAIWLLLFRVRTRLSGVNSNEVSI